MFTQVNVHGISRLDRSLKMFVVVSDDVILRQIVFGIDHVNALKRKNFCDPAFRRLTAAEQDAV
jgi:hypothetical protein